ncbi:MAG TPA: ATP-binding protein [Thermoleophilaceae bacterium]|jgi:serine/threonine-protein kinase RsbW
MEASAANRTVSLTIPAKPDYVVLARLALSAVCRIAPLELEAAADLKLAITEAATFLMGGDRRSAAREDDQAAESMRFSFDLQDDEIVIEVTGSERRTFSEEERELSRAIIDATVDDCELEDGTMRLRKRLGLSAE